MTKEAQFGASMIDEATELLYLDEWTKQTMTDDLLKTILQGGDFAQAIKNQNPRIQSMNAGVYITCNLLPNYGKEQENVEKRLYIVDTSELEEQHAEAPIWIKENSMRCLVWMAQEIGRNIKLVEPWERFYERTHNEVSRHAMVKTSISREKLEEMKKHSIFGPAINPSQRNGEPEIHAVFRGDYANGTYHAYKFRLTMQTMRKWRKYFLGYSKNDDL